MTFAVEINGCEAALEVELMNREEAGQRGDPRHHGHRNCVTGNGYGVKST